jgi:ubiquinone/menaquinone biosynthesis C-methylase UbiE
MSPFDYDESAVAREEANYQTPTARERRTFVRDQIAIDSGESVLSIGCGPGFEPAELATEEPSRSVTGIDVNPVMLSRARERCPGDVSLLRADATHLPVEDGTFDAAVSVQVYEYIEDLNDALAELRRVLDEDGRAVVYATDWDSLVWHATDAERAKRVLDVWDDHCVHPRLGSELQAILQSSGFAVKNVTAFPIVLTELGENTFAHHLLEFVREFVSPHLGSETAQAWTDDLRSLDHRGETFFSLCQYSYLVEPI